MADGTHIEWCSHPITGKGATWNIITGCAVLSPGCKHCYAMNLAGTRLRNHPSRAGLTRQTAAGPVWNGKTRFNEQWLYQPLRWRTPRAIFVVAHGDLFYKGVHLADTATVFDVMARADHHWYQVLTKRPEWAAQVLARKVPMPHVWIGASVENQPWANKRRDSLRKLAEAGWNTWVSYEPALGAVDWTGWEFIKWMVSGGESGTHARPSHPHWHMDTREWCANHGIPYFFKQHGSWAPISREEYDRLGMPVKGYHRWPSGHVSRRMDKREAGALLDGREYRGVPTLG